MAAGRIVGVHCHSISSGHVVEYLVYKHALAHAEKKGQNAVIGLAFGWCWLHMFACARSLVAEMCVFRGHCVYWLLDITLACSVESFAAFVNICQQTPSHCTLLLQLPRS